MTQAIEIVPGPTLADVATIIMTELVRCQHESLHIHAVTRDEWVNLLRPFVVGTRIIDHAS